MTGMTCDEIRDLAPVYVLGALERDEEAAVTEHLRTCSDPHPEMADLGEMTSYLDESITLVEPPPALRTRILAAAADELAARRAGAPVSDASALVMPVPSAASRVAAAAMPTESVRPAPVTVRPVATLRATPGDTADGRVVSLDAARARRRDWRTWALGAAAVFAIVALGAWNVVTQQQLSDARAYQQRLAAAIAQAGQPGSQVAVLTATAPDSGPGGIAVMPATGNGTLVVSGLAPTSGNQVYEAWAIIEGQPPAPVAGFVVGSDGIGYFDKMPNASGETLTVAITLEPAPNPTAPSSEPIAVGVAIPASAVG